jgi:hypothetical protein
VPASDEFDGAALNSWNVLRGDDQGDGVNHVVTRRRGTNVV